MTIGQIIQVIIEVILFLCASYFIFYKSWLAALGKEVAKLSTIEESTKLSETVKKNFNEKIEALKSELAKNNMTHQIQFSFLHQERGKVILELYKKLIELHSAMVDWTNFMHPIIIDAEKEGQERTKRANNATHEFKNFYLSNKLFFSKTFCNSIEELFKEYWDKGWDYGYKQERLKSGQLTPTDFKEYYADITKISKELKDHLPKKIEDVEVKFRKMLSVEEE